MDVVIIHDRKPRIQWKVVVKEDIDWIKLLTFEWIILRQLFLIVKLKCQIANLHEY